MPLSEEQQAIRDELAERTQKLAAEIPGYESFTRQAAALSHLKTGGRKPDFSGLSDREVGDIFDAGRLNPSINGLADVDLAHPLGQVNLMEKGITSARGPESVPGGPDVPASRQYMEMAINTWMEHENNALNPRLITQAQMGIADSPGVVLGGKLEKASFDYMHLQDSVKASGQGDFHDPQIEAPLAQLKAAERGFNNAAKEFKLQAINQAAREGLEFAAKMQMDPQKTAFEVRECGLLDGRNPPDISGADLTGLDLSESDLSGLKTDAETLSRANGLDTVKGVEPKILAGAQGIKQHTERLADLTQRLEKLENKSGVMANLRNIRHGGVDGERKHILKEIDKANEALHQTRAQITADRHAQMVAENPGNEFEPRTTYQLGEDVTRRQGEVKDPRLEAMQASETFKLDAHVTLNEQGSSLAFAKTQIGSKSARMQAEGADAGKVQTTQMLETGALDNVSALYGTEAAMKQIDFLNVAAKKAALGGDVSSLLTRSVATSVVDEALGMNAMAKEKFGIDENGRHVGISVGVPGSSILVRGATAESKESYLDIEYQNPAVQKGLYDLQAQDYITGQIDRHTGNIFVDPHSGQVTGIDNDMAFPVVDREKMIDSAALDGKAVRGAPQFLHSDTADKIEALTPQALRTALQSIQPPDGVAPMEPAAIEGAVGRLEALQAEIKTMRKEGRVVDNFSEDTFNQAMERQQAQGMDYTKPRTSYLAAAVLEQQKSLGMGDARIAIKKDDVPEQRPPGPRLAAYQAMVEDARNDFAANPAQIEDAGLAAVITNGQDRLMQLQNQLQQQDISLAASAKLLNEARQTGPAKRAAGLEKDFDKLQQARQDTLQKIKTERQNVSQALDLAVAPLKPEFAAQARLAAPQVAVAQPQVAVVQPQVAVAQPQNQVNVADRPVEVVDAGSFAAKEPKAKIGKIEPEAVALNEPQAQIEIEEADQPELNEPQAQIQVEGNLDEQQQVAVEAEGLDQAQNQPGPAVQAQQPAALNVEGGNEPGPEVKKSRFSSVRDALKGAATSAKNSVANSLERKGAEQSLKSLRAQDAERDVDSKVIEKYKNLQKELKEMTGLPMKTIELAMDGKVAPLDKLSGRKEELAGHIESIKNEMAEMREQNPGLKQLDRSKVGQAVHSGVRDAAKSLGSKLKT